MLRVDARPHSGDRPPCATVAPRSVGADEGELRTRMLALLPGEQPRGRRNAGGTPGWVGARRSVAISGIRVPGIHLPALGRLHG